MKEGIEQYQGDREHVMDRSHQISLAYLSTQAHHSFSNYPQLIFS